MKSIEGRINIELFTHHNDGLSVDIYSNRPVHASQIMMGKTPEQVLHLLPMMYSVCGVAQARASLSAIMQQLDVPTTFAQDKAREMLVITETAREHLFRIFLDWPELFDIPRDHQAFPSITGLIKRMTSALFKDGKAFSLNSEFQLNRIRTETLIAEIEEYLSTYVFKLTIDEWLSFGTMEDISEWANSNDGIAALSLKTILDKQWSHQGYPHSSALPELDNEQLCHRFCGQGGRPFIEQPDWDGQLFETTALTRQQTHPLIQNLQHTYSNTLITRWLARLVELATIPLRLRQLLSDINQSDDVTFTSKASHGIAQIEAARGKLIHHAEIEHNLVTQYQILAPTEWNFHPKGLIQQSLSHIEASDKGEIEHIARLLINAIDPCVGYDLRVH